MKVNRRQRGSLDDMINAFETKVNELEGRSVESATSIQSAEEVVYQFPKFTPEDRSVARRDYNLSIVRETETDTLASGSIEDIRNFADEYLGYQLNEDYFVESINECDRSIEDEYDLVTL